MWHGVSGVRPCCGMRQRFLPFCDLMLFPCVALRVFTTHQVVDVGVCPPFGSCESCRRECGYITSVRGPFQTSGVSPAVGLLALRLFLTVPAPTTRPSLFNPSLTGCLTGAAPNLRRPAEGSVPRRKGGCSRSWPCTEQTSATDPQGRRAGRPRLSLRLLLMEHRCDIAPAGPAHSRPNLTGGAGFPCELMAGTAPAAVPGPTLPKLGGWDGTGRKCSARASS